MVVGVILCLDHVSHLSQEGVDDHDASSVVAVDSGVVIDLYQLTLGTDVILGRGLADVIGVIPCTLLT